jgi:hypothetical protein
VHVVAVPKGFELGIVAALSDMGVRISNRSRKSSNGDRPRVEVSFKERHLLTEQRKNTQGGIEIALLRAWVMGIMRRNMRRVGRASFRRHFDKGRKRKSRIKNRQR